MKAEKGFLWVVIGMFMVFLTGCSSRFTGFTPGSGAVCDEVRISRENGHRCGTHTVRFNGVEAAGVRVDPGPGFDVIAVVPPGASTGPLTIRQNTAFGCVLIGMLGSDLFELGTFTVTGSVPQAPNITSFRAVPAEISEGEASSLQWAVAGAVTSLRLDNGTAIDVTGRTSYTVNPTGTTEYRLTAANECVTNSARLTVLVNEAQEKPEITEVESGYPEEEVTARGANLRYRPRPDLAYVESSLIFSQGVTAYAPVVDASPADDRLEGNLPAGLEPGGASVRARVGTMESEAVNFTVSGRQNGAFTQVSLATSGTITCRSGGIERTLEVTGSGEERTAFFREGGSLLWRESFNLGIANTGAAFSPHCKHGVMVGQNTARDDNKFILLVHDLEENRTRISEDALGQGVQVLFSPDDSVALFKAQDDFRGPGFAVLHLYDMHEHRNMPDPGAGNACTACNSVSATVEEWREVTIVFDGDDLGPYSIE